MTYLAPAGTVIRGSELIDGFMRSLSGRPHDDLSTLLGQRVGGAQCHAMSSGRAAMTLIFQTMRAARQNEPHRDEVVIPAYTCYSVAAAAIRAGLTPRLCDVDPSTLGMDVDALRRTDFRRVLAVVSANLYGLPNDLVEIERVAREHGVYMLDDAAQALGAAVAGRAAGTFGDAGLFSFDKGKIICTIQGGTLVTHDTPLGQRLARAATALPPSTVTETSLNCVKLLAYVLLLRPRLYGLVRRLPFLGLGATVFETRYPISQLSRFQAGVAARLLARLEEITTARRRNAERLAAALRSIPNVLLPTIASNAFAVYARFPIRITDPQFRHDFVTRLDRNGVGATTSYPLSLADVPEVQSVLRQSPENLHGARTLAAQIVTLPTHAYCPPDLGDRIGRIVDHPSTGSPSRA